MRLTKAEYEALDAALMELVAAHIPITVRGVFYRAVAAGLVPKDGTEKNQAAAEVGHAQNVWLEMRTRLRSAKNVLIAVDAGYAAEEAERIRQAAQPPELTPEEREGREREEVRRQYIFSAFTPVFDDSEEKALRAAVEGDQSRRLTFTPSKLDEGPGEV